MSKYLAFFRIRFINGLQYRTAAWSGVATQFAWGFLEILVFKAFYSSNAVQAPMSFTELTSYVWLQQSFLAMFMLWFWEMELFDQIQNGNIAYELVRPISIYNMWFSRTIAVRASRVLLRCGPILILAFLLPAPYGLALPNNFMTLFLFIVSLILGLLVVVSLNMLVYMLAFFTIDSFGLRMIFQSIGDLLIGSVIPLPFFPESIRKIVEWLPFAAVQNVPFRIYSGNIAGANALLEIGKQIFWCLVLILVGKIIERKMIQQVVVQGG